MRILYPTRSKLLSNCEQLINQQKDILLQGFPVHIQLSSQGYNAKIKVRIDQSKHKSFDTDWESDDPTRFPVRIKAAAFALYQQGVCGSFLITHSSGTLTIQQIRDTIIDYHEAQLTSRGQSHDGIDMYLGSDQKQDVDSVNIRSSSFLTNYNKISSFDFRL